MALDNDEAKVTLDDVPDRPGVAATVFSAVAGEGINVDMIVQNVSHDGRTDLSFTAPLAEMPRLEPVMERVVKEIGATRFSVDDEIAKVSLVGAGMKSIRASPRTCSTRWRTNGINIEMISTSSIRISCVIRKARRRAGRAHDPRAVRAGSRRGQADRRTVSLPPPPPAPDPPSIPPAPGPQSSSPPPSAPSETAPAPSSDAARRGGDAGGRALRERRGPLDVGQPSADLRRRERHVRAVRVLHHGARRVAGGRDRRRAPGRPALPARRRHDAHDPGGRHPAGPAGVRRRRSPAADRQRPERRAGPSASRWRASTRCAGTRPLGASGAITARTVVFARDGIAWRIQFADATDAFDESVGDLDRMLGTWQFR